MATIIATLFSRCFSEAAPFQPASSPILYVYSSLKDQRYGIKGELSKPATPYPGPRDYYSRPMDIEIAIKALAALAQETRLKAFKMLVEAEHLPD